MASPKEIIENGPIAEASIEDGELFLLFPNRDGKPSLGFRHEGGWIDYYTDEPLKPERCWSLKKLIGD